VSGTWRGIDPASLAITGLAGAVQPSIWSDTTGRFTIPSLTLQSGENIIEITGRDRLGRLATASVTVRSDPSLPSLAIDTPADNHYFSSETLTVTGTFSAADGTIVDVNSTPATVTGSTFSATPAFPSALGPLPSALPLIARLTEPGGNGAFDSLRVYRLSEAPRAIETFPAAEASEVDPGVLGLVLFSAPMDRASVGEAFRLENAGGSAVNGTLYLDHDVLTFAPAATLTPGERYTIRISTIAKDLAGQPLAGGVVSAFTIATTAPATAPLITTTSGPFCGNLLDVTGTTTPGARVRIDYGTIFVTTTASSAGTFAYQLPLSGQQGFHVIRVRATGSDGTLSPAAELVIDVDCAGPRVTQATFNRSANELTILFSRDIQPPQTSSFTLRRSDNSTIGLTLGAQPSPSAVTIIPAEDLRASTFTLIVDTTIRDLQDRPLAFAHTQLFSVTGDDDPQPGDGQALIAGEVFDSETGRPLPGATVDILNSQFSILNSSPTDARGRYLARVGEGAHTIRASLDGYTTVTRQVIVAPGTTHTPIDIRLEKKP
jgi:hypothetical protein